MTRVNRLCLFSQCLLYSKLSQAYLLKQSAISLFSPLPLSFDSSLSQVITDLGWSLPREWSEKPRLVDVLPSFTPTLTSPFHEKVLWNCSAIGNWLSVSKSESPRGNGGWQTEGELCFPLHKCQYSLWWHKEILLVTCGFGVTVWWCLYILISVLTRTEQMGEEKVNQSFLPKR